MTASRKPDYKVKAMYKERDLKGAVGAAWANEDKTISVVLDPFIHLQQDGTLLLTLFPLDEKTTKPRKP